VDVRTGNVVADGVVVIEGERITRVGSAGQLNVPADAQVIIRSRTYGIPSAVGAHLHVAAL
jgi:cytosine/adenosine deaminase-related metal-dependent hydrolase